MYCTGTQSDHAQLKPHCVSLSAKAMLVVPIIMVDANHLTSFLLLLLQQVPLPNED
jgi:hypothetical protein